VTNWYSVTIETEGPAPSVEALEALSELLEDLGAHGPAVGAGGTSRGTAVAFAVDPPLPDADELEQVGEVCRWALSTFRTAAGKAGVVWDRLATIEVLTNAQLERRLRKGPERYAGVTEVAQMLGVSKQRIRELRDLEGFPAPVEELAAGPVWAVSSLRRFESEWRRRPGRPSRLWSDAVRLVRDQAAHDQLPTNLTERERQVLSLLVEGISTSEIADRLHVSSEATRATLRRLYAKLGVGSRIELAAKALRDGISEISEPDEAQRA
jgi:DNA-binding CsgD family transcriptional regulator